VLPKIIFKFRYLKYRRSEKIKNNSIVPVQIMKLYNNYHTDKLGMITYT
jgi:hypothetical protein